jgi:predicted dehydrogenase
MQVSAVVTANSARAIAVHEDFPDAKVVSDFAQLLELPLDLIVIASTNEVHAKQAISALRAGFHVVIDKPVGVNSNEVSAIAKAASENGRSAIPFYNRLWDSDTLTVASYLEQGDLGRIFRHEQRFERFRPNLNPGSWRESLAHEQGGGLLLDLQSHLLSVALSLFGPAELEFAAVKDLRGGGSDDVVLVLGHESGVDSYLSASALIGAPGPKLRLNGERGSLIFPELDQQEPLIRSGIAPESGGWKVDTRSPGFLHQGDFVRSVETIPGDYTQFYLGVKRHISSGAKAPVEIGLALAVTQIIDQANEWQRN